MHSHNGQPKVSVCVVSYNHEKYIEECLASIVSQETDFNFEIIVGDDRSTDNTRAIISTFYNSHPNVIKPVFHSRHVGPTKNYLSVHSAAKGQYIAHIDGDDLMLPGKLQIQADNLDKNPECSICFHKVKRYDQETKKYLKEARRKIPRKSEISYLLMNAGLFSHSSKMYRSRCREDLELIAEEVIDNYMHFHHAAKGKILFLNQVLGVYRVNIGIGIDKSDQRNTIYKRPAAEMIKRNLDSLEYARRCGVSSNYIKKAKANYYFRTSYNYLMANDYENFKIYISKSMEIERLNNSQYIFFLCSKTSSLHHSLYYLLKLRARTRHIPSIFFEKYLSHKLWL